MFDTLQYRRSSNPAISFDNKYIVMLVTFTNFEDAKDTIPQNFRHEELWVIEVDKWMAGSGELRKSILAFNIVCI